MAYVNVRPAGGALLPAPEPMRKANSVSFERPPYQITPGEGTAFDAGYLGQDSLIGRWVARKHQWSMAFEQKIARNMQRYWALWRNFDQGPQPGPGQEWRDRTVVPQAFKEIATRVPRIVLGLWGIPEPYSVLGRGFQDETYEEQVRVLIQEALDEIGIHDPQGELFLKRMIDGTTYGQIMGHVWWKPFWRREDHWLKTKLPDMDEEGKIKGWTPIETLEMLYDNVDIQWLPLTHVAIDAYGSPRRWAIEFVRTSLESLEEENDRFKMKHGRDLYPALDLLKDEKMGALTREQTDEPRDTEHWPIDDGLGSHDPGEHPVELWLCFDNVKRTLTKIANRRVVLDHGLSDTPDGLDPFIGDPAVPIPGSPYGDSILNWTGGLHQRQTRISRARMDETMMNMFQQYLFREGALKDTIWFWRPGGGAPISQARQDRPISDSIYLVPRRPLPPEAYAEERYVQAQSEAVAGADAVSQGTEATSKSRDVTAAEINQRVLQGASRFQLEVLYKELSQKKPILQKVFDLLRMNLTQPRMVRILEDTEGVPFDLTKLERPIDIVVGGSLLDATTTEKLAEIREFIAMSKGDSAFQTWLKVRPMLVELLKNTKTLRRNSAKFVKTEEEHQQEMAQMAMASLAAGAAPGGAAPGQAGPKPPALPPGAGGPGGPGPAGVAGPAGAGAESFAAPAGSSVETI
jgi:hypothetical protein